MTAVVGVFASCNALVMLRNNADHQQPIALKINQPRLLVICINALPLTSYEFRQKHQQHLKNR
jgi:hypothetical protein